MKEVFEGSGHQYPPVESWELCPKWQPHCFVETQQNVREASEDTFALHKRFLDCENCLHLSKYIFRHMKCYFLLPGWAVEQTYRYPIHGFAWYQDQDKMKVDREKARTIAIDVLKQLIGRLETDQTKRFYLTVNRVNNCFHCIPETRLQPGPAPVRLQTPGKAAFPISWANEIFFLVAGLHDIPQRRFTPVVVAGVLHVTS